MGLDDRSTGSRACGAELVRVGELLVVPGYVEVLRRAGLDSLDALFAENLGESLDKPGLNAWRKRVRLRLGRGNDGRLLFVKRYADPPRNARREAAISGCTATSLAGVEWYWMHQLAREGIPCMRPVAMGEELRNGHERRSAVVIEAVKGDSLERWAARWTSAERTLIRRLLASLARLVARLHTRGYVHRDLYLSHVFFDPEAPMDDSLTLIDLQRVIRPTAMVDRWRVKDLAALNYSTPAGLVSRADRLRWLRRYLHERRGALATPDERTADARIEERKLAYRVLGKTARIARKDRRRLRRTENQD